MYEKDDNLTISVCTDFLYDWKLGLLLLLKLSRPPLDNLVASFGLQDLFSSMPSAWCYRIGRLRLWLWSPRLGVQFFTMPL